MSRYSRAQEQREATASQVQEMADEVAVATAAVPGPKPAKAASILERRRSSTMVALAKLPPEVGKDAARWQRCLRYGLDP